MNETLTLIDETVPEVDLQWQQRLDELVRGECSEDAFMNHVLNLREAGPYTPWNVVALLDQRYRRGQLPAEVFRSIESKIAQYELADIDYGMTIDLPPETPGSQGATPEPPPEPPPAPTPASANPVAALPIPRATALAAPSAPGVSPTTTATPGPAIPLLEAAVAAPRGSVDRPVSAVPEIGHTLRQRYLIERRLGTGGMGTVFKALDHYRCDLPEGDRHVAIKFLHHRINGRPEILSDLRREFYCAQALAHPNIVKVYELDQDEDFVFFTMEFLEGELLSAVMERLNPRKISRSSAWTLIQGIAAGLSHAHSRNVVHADLKPHNIMITSSGEMRILDFGAASSPERDRAGADANPKSNSTALTPAYASCELLESKPADPRDDLYALACVAYELLAGEHPFQRRRSTEARDLGLVARRPDGLTRIQWNTLEQGLSFRREGRLISVADWLAQLNPPADTLARLSVPLGLTAAAESLMAATPMPARMPAATPTPAPTPVAPTTRAAPAAKPALKPTLKPATPPRSASAPPSTGAANFTSTTMRVVAALAMVVLGFGLWLSLSRRSLDTTPLPIAAAAESSAKSAAGPDAFAPQPLSPQSTPPQPVSPQTSSAASSLSASGHAAVNNAATAGGQALVQSSAEQSPTAQPATNPNAAQPAPHRARVNGISLSSGTYRVRPRQNFAELHVHRTPGAPGSTSFVWWTEPASAAAGVDFVPQARITQLLPAGTSAASLFIRLLPNPSRRHSAVFYVVIGEPGNGATLGRVARTAITLPAT